MPRAIWDSLDFSKIVFSDPPGIGQTQKLRCSKLEQLQSHSKTDSREAILLALQIKAMNVCPDPNIPKVAPINAQVADVAIGWPGIN